MVARLAVIALCLGCGHPHAARPTGPDVGVKTEIELAEQAEKARQHDVAREHYQRAVANAHDPANIAYARHEFAETLTTWGEYPEAIAQFEGSLAARPNNAAAWHDLGLLRHHEGDTPGAIKALERSRELAPKDFRPRKELAVLRWTTGDRAGAAAEYRAMLALDLPERLRTMVEWAIGCLAAPTNADAKCHRPELAKP